MPEETFTPLLKHFMIELNKGLSVALRMIELSRKRILITESVCNKNNKLKKVDQYNLLMSANVLEDTIHI